MQRSTSSMIHRILFIAAMSVLGLSGGAAFAQQSPVDGKANGSVASGQTADQTSAQTSAQTSTRTSAQTSPAQPGASMHPMPNANAPSLPPGIDPQTMTPLYETIQEDWASLVIGASNLQPEPPLVGQEDDTQKTFTRSLVQVKWRPGDPIDLWIIMPKGVKNPPAVLYLYGANQDLSRFRDNNYCSRITSGGMAAVGFVAALTGPRFHDRPMKQWFMSELQESLGSTVHDVKFILDYLAERGDVDMKRVGMFGAGTGGTIAILAAAADPRIKAVDALDPWGDWPNFLKESPVVTEAPDHDQLVKPEFVKGLANLDPVKWLPELKTPVRIQQIRQNEAIPMVCKDNIKSAAPKQAEVVRFDGPLDLSKREGEGRLFEWMKDQLQSIKPGVPSAELATQNRHAKSANNRPPAG